MRKLKLAIIGQGRSGRDIHGAYLKSENNTFFEVAAIVDADARRRQRALEEYPGCQVYADYQELFGRTDLDMVVNTSYSQQHYVITKDLLRHKFNVMVDKPFGRNYFECKDLMKTAEDNGVFLAVFQQSFLAPYYQETLKFIESGKLGDILQIDIHFSGLSRRWDWQTLQCKLGGSVYNTGPHPIGLALGFLDFHPETRVVYSKLACAQTSGDAEDYAKILLTAPGKPLLDIEISAVDAFNPYTIHIQGTKGTYQCTTANFKAKYIPDGENPDRPVVAEFLQNEEGYPIYCGEKLITKEEEGSFDGNAFDAATRFFYEDLYQAMTTGSDLQVPAEYAARVINVIETVHAQNPLPVKFSNTDMNR